MGPRFRLAGDTHLIAWPDISLLGETLRLKDTEYSEVESSETEKRDGEMKLLTRWVLWKKTKHIFERIWLFLLGFF